MPYTLTEEQTRAVAANSLSLDARKVAANLSDTGTGKTIMACELVKQRGRRLAVCSPLVAIPNWFAVAAEFDLAVIGVINYEALPTDSWFITMDDYINGKRTKPGYCINGAVPRWELPPDTLLVFDEAHKGKNNTITSEYMIGAKQLTVTGVEILLMSATLTDDISNFRAAGYILGLCQRDKTLFNKWAKGRDIKQLILHGNPPLGVFVESKYLAKQVTIDLIYDIPQIDELSKEALAADFGTKMRLWGDIECHKVPYYAKFAREKIAEGKAVICFLVSRKARQMLRDELDCLEIGGENSAEERLAAELAFRQGASAIVLSIAVGGVSISLHDTVGKPKVLLLSPTMSGVMARQACGRAAREGTLSIPTAYYIYSKSEYERQIVEIMRKKIEFMEELRN